MKRCFDVAVALTALVLLAPLFMMIGAAILCTEGTPMLYRGLRVGLGGRHFYILKFRTMTRRSAHGGKLTVANDARVTPIGRLLRLSKLDELPQLMNVLRGEMSLVGPRPESPHFVADYTAEQRMVLAVRPGITGPSQVAFRHEERLLTGPNPEDYYRTAIMPAKLAIDLHYVLHRSFWFDLKIMALTAVSLLLPISLSRVGAAVWRACGESIPQEATAVFNPGLNAGTWRRALSQRLHWMVVRRLRAYGLAVVADVLIVAAAFEAATALRFLGIPIAFPTIKQELSDLLLPSLMIGAGYAGVSYVFGLHRRLWRYASLREGFALMQAVVVAMLCVGTLDVALPQLRSLLPLGVVIIGAFLSFLLLGCVKLLPRLTPTERAPRRAGITRVLIVGAGQAGADLASRFLLNSMDGYRVEAFVDDDPDKWNRCIHGKRILGPTSMIPDVVRRLAIDLIAIALPSACAERISQIIALCQETPAAIQIAQSLDEIVGRRRSALNLREVNVADLLGREVVPLQTAEARSALQGKTLLVTGAAGSIGSELCRQLITYQPKAVIALDTNETGLFDLEQSLRSDPNAGCLHLRLGDITDEENMQRLFAVERPQIVFHAAAYKHVPLLEEHPDQAVRTNILGTYLLCGLARQYQAERFVFISSDKAVDPVSMLGASKRIGELLTQAMAQSGGANSFCAVRFGNVIGSRGSVVPTFARQIERGGPITVTDPRATRYFMTIAEACGLVILTAAIPDSSGLFLLDMGEPVSISDLAVKMIRARGLRVGQDIDIIYTGLRPGERLHETLSAFDEEFRPTVYKKILSVNQTERIPDLATIERWIALLQESLREGDCAALRARLFDFIFSIPSAGRHAGLLPLRQPWEG